MILLFLALSLNGCKTASDNDQPWAPPTDVIGNSSDYPQALLEKAPAEPAEAAEAATAQAAAEPVQVQGEPTTASTTAPTIVKRKDCIFVDPDRKTDADGKVTVTCGDKTVQAKASYQGSGIYEFEIDEDDLEAGSGS